MEIRDERRREENGAVLKVKKLDKEYQREMGKGRRHIGTERDTKNRATSQERQRHKTKTQHTRRGKVFEG